MEELGSKLAAAGFLNSTDFTISHDHCVDAINNWVLFNIHEFEYLGGKICI